MVRRVKSVLTGVTYTDLVSDNLYTFMVIIYLPNDGWFQQDKAVPFHPSSYIGDIKLVVKTLGFKYPICPYAH